MWLVRLSMEQVVWVQALARDIVLCSWAREFTLIVPLSTQVYKWVSAKLRWTGIPSGGAGDTHKLWNDEPLGSYTDFT